jgi:hypothetical protein
MFNQFSTLVSICGNCVCSASRAAFIISASSIIFLLSSIFCKFHEIASSLAAAFAVFAFDVALFWLIVALFALISLFFHEI